MAGKKDIGIRLTIDGSAKFIARALQAAAAQDKVGNSAKRLADDMVTASRRIVEAQAAQAKAVADAQVKIQRAQDRSTRAMVPVRLAEAQAREADAAARVQVQAIRQQMQAERMAAQVARQASVAQIAAKQALINKAKLLWSVLRKLGGYLVGGFLSAVKTVVKGVWELGKGFVTAGLNVASFIAKGLIISKLTAILLAAWAAAKSLARQIFELAKSAFDAAANFQVLEIRMTGLIARQIMQEDTTIAVGDAYAMASRQVSRYIDWIKQVAVNTPFGVEEIATTLSLAMAYNFTAGEAQTLTLAIADFAAGMGLSNQEMRRIIENFGQMRAAGKVTGTELRDLARGAFVPVNAVIRRMAENLGIAEDEYNAFRESVARGAVPVDEFFKAFIELANESFPDAAERMSRTWAGVVERTQDFIKTVLGATALGPLLRRMAEIASQGLDRLLSPAVTQAADQVGRLLVWAFDQSWAAIGRFATAIRNMFDTLGLGIPTLNDFIAVIALLSIWFRRSLDALTDWANGVSTGVNNTLAGAAQAAFQWGVNIAVQLAQGLVDGASQALVAAMNYISDMLEHWLAPGSPPLVAPNIDLWGSEAFQQWLKGFTSADFDILKSIQSPLKSALSVLFDLGAISGGQAFNLYKGISEAISQALSGEGFSGNLNKIFEGLTGVAGEFGRELQELLKRQLELVDAVKALEAAEKALEAARKTEDEAISKVASLTNEYNELLRAGADPSVLEAKLAEINAAEDAREAAIEERKAAEENVAVAEERLDPLQEQVKLQEELIQQMLDMTRLQMQFTRQAAGGGVSFDPSGFSFGGIPEFEPPPRTEVRGLLRKDFEQMGLDLEQAIKDAFASAGDALRDAWTQLTDVFKDGWTQLTESEDFQRFQTNITNAWNFVLGVMIASGIVLRAIWGTIVESTKPYIDELIAEIDRLGIDWQALWQWLVEMFGNGLKEILAFVGGVLLLAIAIVVAAFQTVVSIITNVIETINDLRDLWGKALDAIFDKNTDWKTKIIILIATVMETIKSLFLLALSNVLNFVFGFVVRLIDFFVRLYYKLIGRDGTIVTLLNDVKTAFTEKLTEVLEWIGIWITDVVAKITLFAVEMYQLGKDTLQGFWDGMMEVWELFLAWLWQALAQLPQALKDFLGIDSPSKLMMTLGIQTMKGFELGMASGLPGVANVAMQTAAVASTPVAHPNNYYGGSNMTNTMNVNMHINDRVDAERFRNMMDRSFRRMTG